MESGELAVFLTTAPDVETAERLARTLLEERVIACANLLPAMTALFRWEGEVRSESEALLLLKAPAAGAEQVERRLRELHPYEVPEIVRLQVAAVNQSYARWTEEVVSVR